jgi:ribonuclease HI
VGDSTLDRDLVPLRVVVFTDGACKGNPGPGGWAWAQSPDGSTSAAGGEAHSTNQRMELTAVLRALEANAGPVEIVSDSTYVVNCFRDRWWQGWLKRGWKNSAGQPVANRDLWEPLIALYRSRADEIRFRWVKGHSGDPMNELVDQLAVTASAGPFTAPAVAEADRVGDQDSLF